MERKGHLIMARIDKIARLNPDIRTQINSRLADGADGQPILHWLKSLPPVRETLARSFGAPINQQNLSHWRRGGYHDWLAQTLDRSCLVKAIRACPCHSASLESS
jgi:hypothetical protein